MHRLKWAGPLAVFAMLGAAASAQAALVVTPSSELTSPAEVQVSGSGYPANNDSVELFQCDESLLGCMHFITTSTGTSGNFGPVDVTLKTPFTPDPEWSQPEAPETVDCLVTQCVVWAVVLTQHGETAPISFDTDLPETTITKRPPNRNDKGKAKFRFRADEPGSTFECKLKGPELRPRRRQFRPCASPKRYRNLDPGRYRFKVRAIDPAQPAGNTDPTPARDRFRILD